MTNGWNEIITQASFPDPTKITTAVVVGEHPYNVK